MIETLEGREGWGMLNRALCRVVYPRSAEEIVEAFTQAREAGARVAFWGNGRSYGDAQLNEGGLLLDFSRMASVLDFDRNTGVVTVQPGVTLQALSEHVLPHGYWPPVVSGTRRTTLGGCLAANIHGKNNWKHGPIGDHVLAFGFVTPDGETHEVTRASNPELFYAAIGGFGMLGCFTWMRLAMKRVYSGRIRVEPRSCSSLEEMFRCFEQYNGDDWDYVVGWLDAFARGAALGRGQIHAAKYLEEGADPEGQATMSLERQQLPSRVFGVLPKGWLWRFMQPWSHRWGLRLVNALRFRWAARPSSQHAHLESHTAFNHLLDFVPRWKWAFKPGGILQYQLFIPKDEARKVFRRALELQQDLGLESTLLVMKRHRADAFLMSHAVDGYSLAQDFHVTDANRARVFEMARRFDQMVVDAGGKFYFAKDGVVSSDAVRRAFGDRLAQFLWMKNRYDPHQLLQSNLFRRTLAPAMQGVAPQEMQLLDSVEPAVSSSDEAQAFEE